MANGITDRGIAVDAALRSQADRLHWRDAFLDAARRDLEYLDQQPHVLDGAPARSARRAARALGLPVALMACALEQARVDGLDVSELELRFDQVAAQLERAALELERGADALTPQNRPRSTIA